MNMLHCRRRRHHPEATLKAWLGVGSLAQYTSIDGDSLGTQVRTSPFRSWRITFIETVLIKLVPSQYPSVWFLLSTGILFLLPLLPG